MAIIINLKKGILIGLEFAVLNDNNNNNNNNNDDNDIPIYLLKTGPAAAAV